MQALIYMLYRAFIFSLLKVLMVCSLRLYFLQVFSVFCRLLFTNLEQTGFKHARWKKSLKLRKPTATDKKPAQNHKLKVSSNGNRLCRSRLNSTNLHLKCHHYHHLGHLKNKYNLIINNTYVEILCTVFPYRHP